MRVLVAPDRFAGAVTAAVAATALAEGWRESVPSDVVRALPLSDGSAGLVDAVGAALGGRLVPVTVPGPLGAAVPATVLHVPGQAGGTAFVEADQVLGTHLAADRAEAAVRGTTGGLGALVLAALATGAGRVVVGLSLPAAAHDGGAGLLAQLAGGAGADPLTSGGLALTGLTPAGAAAAVSAARERLAGVDLVLALSDDAPLLGLHGAGAVLGQDPAVGPVRAQDLERALGHGCDVLERAAPPIPRRSLLAVEPRPAGTRLARSPGTGAGGGSAFVLQLLGARPLPGAEVVATAVDLAGAVAEADLVLTGAAVLDARSLTASVVATVARAALPRALPVVAVADEVQTSRREVSPLGISATYEVLDAGRRGRRPGAEEGLDALRARGARIARTWSV